MQERMNAGSDLPNVTNAGELMMYETRRILVCASVHAGSERDEEELDA